MSPQNSMVSIVINVSEFLAIPVIQLTDGTYPLNSIQISDTAANLASNASAILLLGTSIAGINISEVITVANAPSLASLSPLITNVTIIDTGANVLGHANELAALGANVFVYIDDTAANLVSNAPAILLLGTSITGIFANDIDVYSGLDVAQVLSLAPLLPLLGVNAFISDTAANLASHATEILALGPLVSSIDVNDGLTVEHALLLPTLLPLMGGPAISDTAVNVLSHANELFALGAIVSIYIEDTTINLVSNAAAILGLGTLISGIFANDIDVYSGLDVAQVLSLSPLLPLLGVNAFISDTAANLASHATEILALGSLVSSIDVNDGLTVEHALLLPTLLLLMGGRAISDTAVNVLSHANELFALGAFVSVYIEDTTTNLVSNAAAILGLGTLISNIYVIDFSNGLTVASALSLKSLLPLMSYLAINDTAANLAGNIPAILELGTLVSNVYVSDFSNGLSVASALSLKSLLPLIGYPIIYDTTANLASHATELIALGLLVSGIYVTDGLTVAHALSLTTLLPLMGNRTITDTAINVLSHANELVALGVNITVFINDSAANLASNAPEILALGTLISNIYVSDFSNELTVASALSLAS